MIKLTINNTVCRLQNNPKVVGMVAKYLEFKHPSYFHMQSLMNRGWDGMIRPMSKAGTFSTGLLPRVLEFLVKTLEDFDSEIEVLDTRIIPPLTDDPIPIKIGKLTLYPHQREAIESVLDNSLFGIPWPRGYIFAGMGAGKTLIMFGIYIAYGKPKTVIFVDNSKLYNQLKADLREIFPNEYGYLQGQSYQPGNIIIAMVKSSANRLKEDPHFFSDVLAVLVDEADLSANKTYKTVLGGCPEAAVRLGFSGTIFLRDLKKDKLLNNTLEERFGKIIYKINSKELSELKIIPKAIIKLIPGITPKQTFLDFKEEFDTVIANNPEHYKIVLARVRYNLLTHKSPIMVFTRFMAQTDALGIFLGEHLNVRVEYVHHKSVSDEVILDFKEGRIPVLVCSLFLKRGLSFPLLKCIINASAGEFYSNPLQILGRGTRNSTNKDRFYFEDILDDGKYLSNHSKKRVLHYKREGYVIRDLRV